MKMKQYAAGLAALILALSMTACGQKTDTSSTSAQSSSSSAAATEAADSSAETTAADESADGSSVDDNSSDADSESDGEGEEAHDHEHGHEDEMFEIPDELANKAFNLVDKPVYTVKSDAAQEDFYGKYEAALIIEPDDEDGNPGICYDSAMGVPMYVLEHLEVKDDGTFVVTDTDTSGDAELTEDTVFSYTYEDGKLVGSYTDEEYGDTVEGHVEMTEDGQVTLTFVFDEGETGMVMLFNKVDDFTDFDFSTVTFDEEAYYAEVEDYMRENGFVDKHDHEGEEDDPAVEEESDADAEDVSSEGDDSADSSAADEEETSAEE